MSALPDLHINRTTEPAKTNALSQLRRLTWALVVAFIVGAFLAYYPVWHGALLWDDDGHITKPALRSWDGLWRIWTQPGAAQQYYPLVHTVFWIEHKLWGADTLGYHFLNIILHAISALLLVRVLKQLNVPGAWLAGALFVFHPVHVETVAWITELKNTMSTVFYLGAASVYLRFDATRSARTYWLALFLFVLGLFCKTVIATLPAALLVVMWWKRGKIRWRDIVATIPFFVCGVAGGLFTAWVEKTYIGASGSEFHFTFIERCLIACRGIVFYAGKLVWPAGLSFNYPRWDIRQDMASLYIYPLIVGAVLSVCWMLRRRWPGFLASMLIFIGGLFPALGFFNVYPFRYSFVADHFQYLASIALLSLFGAAVTTMLARHQLLQRKVGRTFCVVLPFALASGTFAEAFSYRGPEPLWCETVRQNPRSWLALDNLGILYNNEKNYRLAESYIKRAMALRPQEDAGDYFNLAENEATLGRKSDAVAHYLKAIQLDPKQMLAHANVGKLLAEQGRIKEALGHFREAERLDPTSALNQFNVGYALALIGQNVEAVAHLYDAVRLDPAMAQAHYQLATVLTALKKRAEAIKELKIALQADANSVTLLNDLAWALATSPEAELRDGGTSLNLAERACALTGTNEPVCVDTLAAAYAELGRFDEAVRYSRIACDIAAKLKQKGMVEDYHQHTVEYEAGRPVRQ
jgi:tetratricopeptide (TPR) repeat protein